MVVTFKYGPSYAPRTYASVYVSVQESVEAKATLAPGLLWRLVRSNRCPAASCVYSGKRFHYSAPMCTARGIWRAKSLGEKRSRNAQSWPMRQRVVTSRVFDREERRNRVFRREKETGSFLQEE